MATRPFETRYFSNLNMTNVKRAMSRGFPKAEEGSIKGAAKVVAQGFANKVQCIDRANNEVVWTVKALPKVRGVNIRPTAVFKGDPDHKPVKKKEGPT